MQTVLKHLEGEPVGIAHLRRSVPAHVRVVEFDKMPTSIDQLFGKKKAVIVLYDMHSSEGATAGGAGHYIVLIKRPKGLEYFSSYGLAPPVEVAATHSNPKKFSFLPRKLIVNRTKFQSKRHTATCGRWAYSRALLADLDLKHFQKYFSGKVRVQTPDDLVSIATIFAIH